MSQFLTAFGLFLDIVGVLLLSAGLLSGRKTRILTHIDWLKTSEEMRASSVAQYEALRKRLHDYRDSEDINTVGSIKSVDAKVDAWIADVNNSRDKLPSDIDELKSELDLFQLGKEKVGVIFLVIGFLLQIIGTIKL